MPFRLFAPGNFIETLTATELASTLPALYRLFDALRGADLSHTTGFGMWDAGGQGSHDSWKAYLLDVFKDHESTITHGWKQHLRAKSELQQGFDELYEMFKKDVDACPEIRELIHSDLLNCNLLVLNRKMSGVIDWQCSLYGDSLYDIAWFLYYAPWYPQFGEIGLGDKLLEHYKKSSPNSVKLSERLQCYFLHIGLGSIAYNAFKKDWTAAQAAADYTSKICTKL